MSQYLDEYDVAEALEADVKDIIELIRYGALPARRDSDGWAIAERDLRRFRAQWGNDVAAALEDAEEQEEDGGFITYVGKFIEDVVKIGLGIVFGVWLLSSLFRLEFVLGLR